MGEVNGYITITEAAKRAGYRSASALKRAALVGRLETIEVHGRLRLTRQEWLDVYLQNLDKKRGSPRGKPRKEQTP